MLVYTEECYCNTFLKIHVSVSACQPYTLYILLYAYFNTQYDKNMIKLPLQKVLFLNTKLDFFTFMQTQISFLEDIQSLLSY